MTAFNFLFLLKENHALTDANFFSKFFWWNSALHASHIEPLTINGLFYSITVNQDMTWQEPKAKISISSLGISMCWEKVISIRWPWIDELKAMWKSERMDRSRSWGVRCTASRKLYLFLVLIREIINNYPSPIILLTMKNVRKRQRCLIGQENLKHIKETMIL